MENEKYRSKSTKGHDSTSNKYPKSKKFHPLSKVKGKTFTIVSQTKIKEVNKIINNGRTRPKHGK